MKAEPTYCYHCGHPFEVGDVYSEFTHKETGRSVWKHIPQDCRYPIDEEMAGRVPLPVKVHRLSDILGA
jgi:hypothetical protein